MKLFRSETELDAPSRCLAEACLVIIGAGPTGIAALLAAHRSGIDAIAIEAGSGPLGAVRAYPSGLIFTSPAHHYELRGLPLDCRDPSELTREELLSYYGRVVQVGGLRIERLTQLVGLRRTGNRWSVQVIGPRGPAYVLAEEVLLTAWFRRRTPTPELLDPYEKTTSISSFRDPTELAGKRVVVVGGGLSAVEHATQLMALGARVSVVARHSVSNWEQDPAVARLTDATGSEWVGGASSLQLSDGYLSFVHGTTTRRVACDVLVACLGMELNTPMVRLAAELDLLRPEDVRSLTRARTFDTVRRQQPELSIDEIAREAVASWPDLTRSLVYGVHGSRVAGGILHAGGAHAGIVVSIRTAELAVAAIAGESHVQLSAQPLPHILFEWAQEHSPTPPPFESVKHLRPLAVGSWSRGIRLGRIELPGGASTERGGSTDAPTSCRFVTNVLRTRPQTARFLGVANGRSTLEELARKLGCGTGQEFETLAASFYWLCRSNALSWLPPRRESDPVDA